MTTTATILTVGQLRAFLAQNPGLDDDTHIMVQAFTAGEAVMYAIGVERQTSPSHMMKEKWPSQRTVRPVLVLRIQEPGKPYPTL